MEKHQNKIFWAVLVSESTHIFCCVLPTVFSLLSLFAGLGLIGVVPAGFIAFHDLMHEWEVPMIIASGLILALGWGLYLYSQKIDCHDTGCGHEPCSTKKNKAQLILKIATGLFVVNLIVYAVFHRNMAGLDLENVNPTHQHEEHHHGHGHDH